MMYALLVVNRVVAASFPHTVSTSVGRLSHLRDVYGDVYQLQCGGKRVVVLSSLEAILQGLVHQGEDVSSRPDFESYGALYHTSRHQGVCACACVCVCVCVCMCVWMC